MDKVQDKIPEKPLIEPYWNVNLIAVLSTLSLIASFNRSILECKLSEGEDKIRINDEPINRTILERKCYKCICIVRFNLFHNR